jgi:hypothetical protein
MDDWIVGLLDQCNSKLRFEKSANQRFALRLFGTIQAVVSVMLFLLALGLGTGSV